jgi:hypothetical protein
MNKQTTGDILMVRPANFGFNEQTAVSNTFQNKTEDISPYEIAQKARVEFDDFVSKLREVGIVVNVIEDTFAPIKPDAVFPNNWIAFFQDGTVGVFPMLTPSRRVERRMDLLEKLEKIYRIDEVIHFESFEEQGLILEGTGSLIFDRVNKIVYACLSPRTDIELIEMFCSKFKYEACIFRSYDHGDTLIYHTNVMMAIGKDFCVICLESIRDRDERALVERMLNQTGKKIVEISLEQMNAFAGNMLQLSNDKDEDYLVMSETAYKSLLAEQLETLTSRTKILHSSLDTIETIGGGSARCMMAEVFLPRR